MACRNESLRLTREKGIWGKKNEIKLVQVGQKQTRKIEFFGEVSICLFVDLLFYFKKREEGYVVLIQIM